jgi:exonuclease III
VCVQHNIKGGLNARHAQLDERGVGFDKWTALSTWVDKADVVSLQETGIMGGAVPAALANHIGPHTMVCHGGTGNKGSVALIVNNGWAVGRIWRDPVACRAVGVLIHRGNTSVFACSTYLPTGLDGKSAASADGTEALRVTGLVNGWWKQADCDHVYIGGDMNQTTNGGRGSIRNGILEVHPARPTPGVVESFLGVGLVDLYAACHPNRPLLDSFTREGRTRTPGLTSISRIDYVFVNREWWEGAVKPACIVEDNTTGSDHRVITMRLSLATTAKGHTAPNKPRRGPCARGVPLAKRKAAARAVQRKLLAVYASWKADMIAPLAGSPEVVLERAQARFNQCVLEAVRPILPANGRKGKKYKSPALCAARKRRAHWVRARNVLKCIREGSQKWWGSRWNNCTRLLRKAGLAPDVREDDRDGWLRWGLTLPALIRTERRVIADAIRSMQDHPRHYLHTAFHGTRQTGRFYKEVFESRSTSVLRSAVDPVTVVRTFQPARVKSLVRDMVSKPFSSPHQPLPYDATEWKRTPCTGRCNAARWHPPLIPVQCLDARCTGCLPQWWDRVYAPEGKGVDPAIFASILDPPTANEVLRTIRKSKGGKAAGPDKFSIDLLKLVVDGALLGGDTPIALRMVTDLTSFAFRHSVASRTDKANHVSMLPKPQADGSWSRDADKMRPIMVGNEIYKLRQRVLAYRLGEILLTHPDIIDAAQRGFLRQGCTAQCIDVLVDILEDYNSSKAGKNPLLVMLYDQSKAYDSVQWYALKAALRRCRLPDNFISYVRSCLDGAKASVHTAHGLTAPFVVRTGVRQGDPLSPLLYLFFIDPLLHGMRSRRSAGYTFSNNPGLRVPVAGYADDTITYNESTEDARHQHAWARAWFGANCAKINAKKCDLLVAGMHLCDVPRLYTVNGTSRIEPHGPDHIVRYLGVFTSLSLDWSRQLDIMESAVQSFCSRVRLNHLDLVASAASVNGYLLPKLEGGLRVIPLSSENKMRTDRWSSKVSGAVLSAAGIGNPHDGRLCQAAIRLMTGTVSISDMHWITQCTEAYVRINSHGLLTSATAWSRLGAATHENPGDVKGILARVNSSECRPRHHSFHRWRGILRRCKTLGIRMRYNEHPWFRQLDTPAVATSGNPSGSFFVDIKQVHQDGLRRTLASGGPRAHRSTNGGLVLYIRLPGGRLITETVADDARACDVLQHLTARGWTPPENRELCFRDTCMSPNSVLAECGVRSGCTLTIRPGPLGFTRYYTDGSTPMQVSDGLAPGNAGFACIRLSAGNVPDRSLQGTCRNTGNNYSVECAGVLSALLDARIDEDVAIYTDCQAHVHAQSHANITHRHRCRSGSRAYNTTIRKVIKARQVAGGCCQITYVPAHTGGTDIHSRANAVADRLAKSARHMYQGTCSPFTYNDEQVLFFTPLFGDHGPPNYVSGDLRKVLKSMARVQQQRRWAGCTGRQGAFPKRCSKDIQSYCTWLSKTKNPALLRFAVLAALRQLPTPGRFFRRRPVVEQLQYGSCPLCHSGTIADSEHAITCPWLRLARTGYVRDFMSMLANTSAEPNSHPTGRLAGEWAKAVRWPLHIPPSRAEWCAYWYILNNPYGSRRHFLTACHRAASLGAKPSVSTSVLNVLREEFSLEVQVNTSVIYHDPSFPRWFSAHRNDILFGAEVGFVAHATWSGMFAWVDCDDDMAREIIIRFNGLTTTAPVRLVICSDSDFVTNMPTRDGRTLLCQTILNLGHRSVHVFQNVAATAAAPVHWRRLHARLASANITLRAPYEDNIPGSLPSPVNPLVYWIDPEAPTSRLGFLPPPGVSTVVEDAMYEQHVFDRYAAMLGAQPPNMLVTLQFMRPHLGILELSELAAKLRVRALDGAHRLFMAYSKGLHRWIDAAATGDHLTGMLTLAATTVAQRRNAYSLRLRDRTTLAESNRLFRSRSSFPMVRPDDDDVDRTSIRSLRSTIHRRWSIARD